MFNRYLPAGKAIVILTGLSGLAGCASLDENYRAINTGSSLTMEGYKLANARQWPEAEQVFRAALDAYQSQQKYNVDPQRHSLYNSLSRAQAAQGKCEEAGYSMRSAIKIVLTAITNEGTAQERVDKARTYIIDNECRIASGETLVQNGRTFLENNAAAAVQAVANAERARIRAAEEAERRRAESRAQAEAMNTMIGALAQQNNRNNTTNTPRTTTSPAPASNLNAQRPQQNVVTPQPGGRQPTSPPATASQMNTGSAKNMQPAGNPQNGQVRSADKFVSEVATHCVEVVPNGFKCSGPSNRWMFNKCTDKKISVWWSVGNGATGLEHFAPGQCRMVSYYNTTAPVRYRACSWDARATYGPSDGCRY